MTELNTEALKEQYQQMSDFELKTEVQKLYKIPEARTNVEALTKMTVLMEEFEKRGIELPKARSSSTGQFGQESNEGSSINIASMGLGALFVIGGFAATAFTNRIFYGAIIVGGIMIVKSFFSSKQ